MLTDDHILLDEDDVDKNEADAGTDDVDENVSLGVTMANKIKTFIGYSTVNARPNQRGRSLCRSDTCPEPANRWMSTQIRDGKCPLCFVE